MHSATFSADVGASLLVGCFQVASNFHLFFTALHSSGGGHLDPTISFLQVLTHEIGRLKVNYDAANLI